jgi:hypothetical protein
MRVLTDGPRAGFSGSDISSNMLNAEASREALVVAQFLRAHHNASRGSSPPHDFNDKLSYPKLVY